MGYNGDILKYMWTLHRLTAHMSSNLIWQEQLITKR